MAAAFDLARYFTPADLQRGAEWSRLCNVTNLTEMFIDFAVLLAFALGPPGRWWWKWLAARLQRSTAPMDRILGPDWRTGAVFLGSVTLLRNLVMFPIFVYVHFVVAHRIGLSQQTFSSFLRHVAVLTMLEVCEFMLLGGIIGAVRSRWPRGWWLTIGASAAVLLIADAAFEPIRLKIEYRVVPLAPGALLTRIDTLAKSLDAHLGQVVVVDTSKRSTEANAFVTGFGPTQEVVITDNLIALGDEAVMGAVAHEIGHRHDSRVPGRLALAGLGMIALMGLVELTLRFASRHGAAHSAQGLLLVMVMVSVVLFAVLPLRMARSRAEEREADSVELSVRRDYDAYIAEQVNFVRSNAIDPSPSPMLQQLFSHPSAAERIATALEYRARFSPKK